MTNGNQRLRYSLYLLFAISGFSGLIYESIWSHYLKLFLGHAAYAQTLVLAIFMGGMAIGAWILSVYGSRWKQLLLNYALVEAVIGICALLFHNTFVVVTDTAFDSLIPLVATPWVVTLLKWILAAILILPQSILLGSTFPLMSAGLIRRYPTDAGASLATLYFTNSLGAAIGVLVGGFILIDSVGLPGTILTAGLLNIAVALMAWYFAKNAEEPLTARSAKKVARHNLTVSWRLLMTAAFVTGATSFVYEIGWIRMLSLVLGSSSHAFELMLSAFILGLALGGLWMRPRIDRLTQPTRLLAWVQVTMGILALLTLIAYNTSFDLMQLLLRSVTTSDGGYALFNIASQLIAIMIMMPATFCAGMTLPLITHILLRGGHGEKSIGAVYSVNTFGAIVGVFLATHIGLPALGLKGLIGAGALFDMALGIAILVSTGTPRDRGGVNIATIAAAVVFISVLAGVQFDRYKMASGVYRFGHLFDSDQIEFLYHKDGKTTTVDLLKHADGSISIVTNGKTDANINMLSDSEAHPDEYTMTLAGGLPLLLHPRASTAAVIGMGSGLTTNILLSDGKLDRIDTIEIEPAMIEAARGFGPRVGAPFSDPRSRFYIDDAKTYFSANQSRYDVIVSEPSNTWVSGVSGLFTDEFYRRARTHLHPNGIFVQWIHIYEMNFDLVASVMKAIAANFSDYGLYIANDGDLLVVAVRENRVPTLGVNDIAAPELAQALHHIDIHSLQDLQLRYLGDRSLLQPLFDQARISANSDYFPVLDLHAVRARFMKQNVSELTWLRAESIPIIEMLGGPKMANSNIRPAPTDSFLFGQQAHRAAAISDNYANNRLLAGDKLDLSLLRHIQLTLRLANDCEGEQTPTLWLESVEEVMKFLTPGVAPTKTKDLWRRFRTSECHARLKPIQREKFALFEAVGRRDGREMAAIAEKLLAHGRASPEQNEYVLKAGMTGYLAENKPMKALLLWKTYASYLPDPEAPDIATKLLLAHGVQRSRRQP